MATTTTEEDKSEIKPKIPLSGTHCCVTGCRNYCVNTTNVSFYRFPNERWHNIRREMWINVVSRGKPLNADKSPWRPTEQHRVCSVHFVGGKKVENPMSPSYIPTLHLGYDNAMSKETSPELEASDRYLEELRTKLQNVISESEIRRKDDQTSSTADHEITIKQEPIDEFDEFLTCDNELVRVQVQLQEIPEEEVHELRRKDCENEVQSAVGIVEDSGAKNVKDARLKIKSEESRTSKIKHEPMDFNYGDEFVVNNNSDSEEQEVRIEVELNEFGQEEGRNCQELTLRCESDPQEQVVEIKEILSRNSQELPLALEEPQSVSSGVEVLPSKKARKVWTSSTNYKCPKCSRSYASSYHLHKHECYQSVDTPLSSKLEALVNAKGVVEEGGTSTDYKCEKCGTNFKSEFYLIIHQCPIQNARKWLPCYKCKKCNKFYKSPSLLEKHECRPLIIGDNYFSSKELGETPPSTNYKCEKCGKTYASAFHFKKHCAECQIVDVASSVKPPEDQNNASEAGGTSTNYKILCEKCNCTFKTEFQLFQHNCKICEICNKTFKTKTDFERHGRSHSGEKPYKCAICDKCFSEKFHMRNHLKLHDPQKEYRCGNCGKLYSMYSSLLSHLKTIHANIKPCLCEHCGKRFGSAHKLKLHVRTTHLNERPFLCELCGMSFGQRSTLKTHTRLIHENNGGKKKKGGIRSSRLHQQRGGRGKSAKDD